MAVTDVLLTLACTVALALVVAGRIEWAGLAVGLAASAKYPGVDLVVPLVVAAWGRWTSLARRGAARARRLRAHEPVRARPRGRRARRSRACSASPGTAGSGSRTTRGRRSRSASAALGRARAGCCSLGRRRSSSPRCADRGRISCSCSLRRRLLAAADAAGGALRPLRAAARAGARRRSRAACDRRGRVFAALLVDPARLVDRRRAGAARTDTRLRADAWIARQRPARRPDRRRPVHAAARGATGRPARAAGAGPAFDPRRSVDALRADGVRWVLVSGAVTDRVLAAATATRARRVLRRARAGRRGRLRAHRCRARPPGRGCASSGCRRPTLVYAAAMNGTPWTAGSRDRRLPLRRRAARGRDHREPRARADLRQLALRLGLADRHRPHRSRGRLRAGWRLADRSPSCLLAGVLTLGALLVLAIPLVDHACSPGSSTGIPARGSTRCSPPRSSARRASCSPRRRRSRSASPRARSSGSAAPPAACSRSRPPAASSAPS